MILPYTGEEPGAPDGLQTGPFFDYDAGIIRLLLDRSGALGVRFHFDQNRPNFPTALYAAACGPVNDLKDHSANSRDYFLPNGQAVAFENLPTTVRTNFQIGGKTAGCVFFSRAILEGRILGTELSPTGAAKVRLFVKDFGQLDSRDIPCLTLVAIGLDSNGLLNGPFIRSEQPCPPNCPSDPDNPYGVI